MLKGVFLVLQTEMNIEQAFLQRDEQQRADIIYHGTLLRLSELRKRRFLAESKVRELEERYAQPLWQLEQERLPQDASIEMHEDYILWGHWVQVAADAAEEIHRLEPIVNQPIPPADLLYASR